ncbi:hypothetical protein BGX28_002810 [Mortierella sp. GBA30]|nr:hypothetical protein BGX28_002810 [Mortierella sp. GBA30]
MNGYQEEEGEFDATIGSTFLRQIKGVKRKREKAVVTVFSGTLLDHLVLQSIQLVLRKQLYALIHDLGFPAELEQVAFEYWTLYMSKLKVYQDSASLKAAQSSQGKHDQKLDQDDQDEGSQTGNEDETGDQKHLSDAIDKMDELLRKDIDSSSEGEDEYENEEQDDDQEQDSESEADENQTGSSRSKKAVFGGSTPDARRLNLAFTIAICYLSAQHLKIPVVLGDFYQ